MAFSGWRATSWAPRTAHGSRITRRIASMALWQSIILAVVCTYLGIGVVCALMTWACCRAASESDRFHDLL